MNISLEDFSNDPDKNNERSEREIKRKLKRMGNPIWGVLWRLLICCALIDIPIWAYFHFVKNVPILVGLQQMSSEIQEKFSKPVTEHPKGATGDRVNGATKSGSFSLLDGVNYWSFFVLFSFVIFVPWGQFFGER